jgi:hypothetical protein
MDCLTIPRIEDVAGSVMEDSYTVVCASARKRNAITHIHTDWLWARSASAEMESVNSICQSSRSKIEWTDYYYIFATVNLECRMQNGGSSFGVDLQIWSVSCTVKLSAERTTMICL